MRSWFPASLRRYGFAVALLLASALARAQDLTFTPIEWIFDEDAPDALPALHGLRTPRTPTEIRALNEPAYAQVRTVVDAAGKRRTLDVDSTSPWLEAIARSSHGEARFKPAHRGNTPVMCQVQSFLIFNPKSATVEGPDATPRLLHIVPPLHPQALARDPEEGVVTIEAEITETGEVRATRAVGDGLPPVFQNTAALAVRRWKFAPARSASKPIAATIRVPVLFTAPAVYPFNAIQTPPKIRKQLQPLYPFPLRRAGLTGEVLIEFIVSVEGRVREAHIVRSNNPYFDQAALDSVLAWTFAPAQRNGEPVDCRMRVPIVFGIEGRGDQGLYYVRRDRKALEKLSPELQWDHPPVFKSTSFAAYPFEQLQAGVEGEVKAGFIIGPNGRVVKVQILSSPHPAFSRAAEAMLDTFEFTPASKNGKPSFAGLSFEVRFDRAGTTEAPVNRETLDLLGSLTKKPERFTKLSQLDARPRPISQRPPVFPSSLKSEVAEGSAQIEYIIDRKGVVHAPRIISASHEEFGYAAAQAVATWKFSPPKKDGKAVDAIVQQPFSFTQKSPSGTGN